MRNFSDFNEMCNIKDVIILAVILEYRWQKIKNDIGFDPRFFVLFFFFSILYFTLIYNVHLEIYNSSTNNMFTR